MNDDNRILILEDNPEDAELVEDSLRRSDIRFISKRVETEDEFRNSLIEFSPDLILSDYYLPIFTGIEALRITKEIRPAVPFILVTGALGEERAIEIMTGGATDYVMKNRLSRLVPAVERALKETEEYKKRQAAELERDLLLKQLEARVQERTAELQEEITERKRTEEALRKYKDELEDKVKERTAQLTEINKSMLAEIEERKRTEKRLRSAQKNLRAMATEIVMADERSRQNFAADLHDTVIQTIAAAKMRSQLIQGDIPEKASEDFRVLQDFISQSITQARFIMAEMSPPVLNELGFIPAMEWLTEQIENQHGIKIEFNAANGFKPLQHEIQVLLFQATRELLMNVVKHAGAGKAFVKVLSKMQKVRIEVIDNGKGFDKRQAFRTDVSSGGYGLFSIRERIRHFGGHLIIKSEEGNGTRVVLTAPRTSGGGR